MSPVRLCALADIEDGGSAAFVADFGDIRLGVMAIRKGDTVFTYVNSCPHIGAPLDFKPGQFLTSDKTRIICSTHGALFRIEDGFCVSGPCADENLEALACHIDDGEVFVREPASGQN